MKYLYVVDDDEAIQLSLYSLLKSDSALVRRSFASGDAFLAELDELDPGVVLLDVHMPGTDGIEVLLEMRRREAPMVTIVVTGMANIAMAVKAVKHGAYDFIEKPYEPAALIATLDAAFAHHQRKTADVEREQIARDKVARLSPREREILMGLIGGKANKMIAAQLDLSPRTVEIYRANLMQKLQVRSLSDALRIAFAAGLIADG